MLLAAYCYFSYLLNIELGLLGLNPHTHSLNITLTLRFHTSSFVLACCISKQDTVCALVCHSCPCAKHKKKKKKCCAKQIKTTAIFFFLHRNWSDDSRKRALSLSLRILQLIKEMMQVTTQLLPNCYQMHCDYSYTKGLM